LRLFKTTRLTRNKVHNPANTKVLLIGNSIFPNDTDIEPIPNVLVNLELLSKCLQNPQIVGVPKANITVLTDQPKQDIERKLFFITDEVKAKDSTLLIYYTGHGMFSDRDYRFYLATNDSHGMHCK